MTKELLKVYFPRKEDPTRFLPIEIEMMKTVNGGDVEPGEVKDFNKHITNIKNNFTMFVAQIFAQEPDLNIETDIDKCKFERVTIEEIDINAV